MCARSAVGPTSSSMAVAGKLEPGSPPTSSGTAAKESRHGEAAKPNAASGGGGGAAGGAKRRGRHPLALQPVSAPAPALPLEERLLRVQRYRAKRKRQGLGHQGPVLLQAPHLQDLSLPHAVAAAVPLEELSSGTDLHSAEIPPWFQPTEGAGSPPQPLPRSFTELAPSLEAALSQDLTGVNTEGAPSNGEPVQDAETGCGLPALVSMHEASVLRSLTPGSSSALDSMHAAQGSVLPDLFTLSGSRPREASPSPTPSAGSNGGGSILEMARRKGTRMHQQQQRPPSLHLQGSHAQARPPPTAVTLLQHGDRGSGTDKLAPGLAGAGVEKGASFGLSLEFADCATETESPFEAEWRRIRQKTRSLDRSQEGSPALSASLVQPGPSLGIVKAPAVLQRAGSALSGDKGLQRGPSAAGDSSSLDQGHAARNQGRALQSAGQSSLSLGAPKPGRGGLEGLLRRATEGIQSREETSKERDDERGGLGPPTLFGSIRAWAENITMELQRSSSISADVALVAGTKAPRQAGRSLKAPSDSLRRAYPLPSSGQLEDLVLVGPTAQTASGDVPCAGGEAEQWDRAASIGQGEGGEGEWYTEEMLQEVMAESEEQLQAASLLDSSFFGASIEADRPAEPPCSHVQTEAAVGQGLEAERFLELEELLPAAPAGDSWRAQGTAGAFKGQLARMALEDSLPGLTAGQLFAGDEGLGATRGFEEEAGGSSSLCNLGEMANPWDDVLEGCLEGAAPSLEDGAEDAMPPCLGLGAADLEPFLALPHGADALCADLKSIADVGTVPVPA